MADRFDEGKRALGDVPARDVWAEAERRAGDDPVSPLAVAPTPTDGRSRRWIAGAAAGAAAVALLAVGTAALLADDDSSVDTSPTTGVTTDGGSDEITTYQADGACKVAIRGEPLPEPTTVSPAETFVEGTVGTLVAGELNATQTYGVQVPGQVVIDLVGERVEDVQLERGTAQLWFQRDGAVQVRWFTGSHDACESFTVTVAGGTEDEDRHAAVDLADRVLLPSDLPNEDPDPGLVPNPLGRPEPTTTTIVVISTVEDELAGTWEMVELQQDGEPVGVPDGEMLVELTPNRVAWNDGCTGHAGRVGYGRASITVTEIEEATPRCPSHPGRDLINALFGSGTIDVALDGTRATLTAGGRTLVLQRGP